ncbi:ATPase, T2SS/T4P/T4SS family [Granulosicoccus antarcticus]|uniref:Conjugal transfer protein n=1 Tax=Granulosicoccus antarcticus IMCC3135 TaxID=1192854 RepID=A0A2Z2NTQ6_9GAMM|nr:ATPase, T2SS/T4P/T4SS family [Granulosicoccus antarcticus]ASJ74653.1 Putative conjugal transfer protein [Granulosicoccus antarcticus IMCC3135]
MFDFYYQQGNSRRKLFQAKGSHCSVGSARNNDLIIDSRLMSKRHAELRLEQDGVYLRDLGSLSGTWINRERIVDYGPLSDLDEIEVGDISVSFRSVRMMSSNEAELNSMNASQGGNAHQDADASQDKSAGPSANAARRFDRQEMSPASAGQSSTAGQTVGDFEEAGAGITSDNGAQNEEVSQANLEDADDKKFDQALAYWGRIIHEQLLFQMDLRRKDVNRMSDEQLRTESSQLISEIIRSLSSQLPDSLDRVQLSENVLNESVGLGPLEQFLSDESVTEIMVNNYREIFVERAGRLERSSAHFSSDATVFAVIERIITPLGRRIDESSPIVDARLKDGSRVNAIIPPLALKGPSLTIRKFPKHRLQFSDLVACDSVSQAMVDFLRVCVEMRKNIIVSGGTGSGKTTLLNVLSNFIPDTDRIVTIEDAAELKLVQPNLVSLESRPSNLEGKGAVPIRDLVKNSLRMRPDRIVVGECRGGEAIDMLQAMNTGHDGSLTTIHANTPRDVLSRLEVLILMAGMDLPVTAIREQVASAVDLIIQQTRFPCGSRKITRITEVVGVESGTVQLQDIFRFEQQGVNEQRRVRGYFSATGAIPTFYEELRSIGMEVDLSAFRSRAEGGLG